MDTLGSVHTTPGSTASASQRGRRDRAPVPAALASRIDLGGSPGARAPAARPCLTASTPAPISPPAVGTPQCAVLTAYQIERLDQRPNTCKRLGARLQGQDQVPCPA